MKTKQINIGKRESLKEYLLNEIRLRKLKPGDKLYSRTEFMKRFCCARATVEHVISELKRKKILVGKNGSGTYVSKPPVRGAVTTIAIVRHTAVESYMGYEMARGFTDQLKADFTIQQFDYDDLKQPEAWEKCKANRGIVFIQPDVAHTPLLYDARYNNIPNINLYRDTPESSFVCIDNYGAISTLVDFLYKQGCRRIAFVGSRVSRYHFQEQRYAGYLQGLLRNGLPFDPSLVGHLYEEDVAPFLDRLFISGNRPDAVFVCEFPLGLIIKAAKINGLEPGRDVVLAYLDEVPPNTYSFKVVSPRSITEEVGREGAKAFMRILDAPNTLIRKFITPEVIIQ